jgi:hypothetical protein
MVSKTKGLDQARCVLRLRHLSSRAPAPNAPGERRPTGTEPRKETEPTLWAVRSTGLFGRLFLHEKSMLSGA